MGGLPPGHPGREGDRIRTSEFGVRSYLDFDLDLVFEDFFFFGEVEAQLRLFFELTHAASSASAKIFGFTSSSRIPIAIFPHPSSRGTKPSLSSRTSMALCCSSLIIKLTWFLSCQTVAKMRPLATKASLPK